MTRESETAGRLLLLVLILVSEVRASTTDGQDSLLQPQGQLTGSINFADICVGAGSKVLSHAAGGSAVSPLPWDHLAK